MYNSSSCTTSSSNISTSTSTSTSRCCNTSRTYCSLSPRDMLSAEICRCCGLLYMVVHQPVSLRKQLLSFSQQHASIPGCLLFVSSRYGHLLYY
jgi:hypothetical protein